MAHKARCHRELRQSGCTNRRRGMMERRKSLAPSGGSSTARAMRSGPGMTKRCEFCGSAYGARRRNDRHHRERQRYCSITCANRGRHKPWRERFWSRVLKGPSCWTWTGSVFDTGYGQFSRNGRPENAARTSWEIANGQIPAGCSVLHHCDNRPCVRPSHLYLGTPADNARDCVSRGRHSHAKLTPDQVLEVRRRRRNGENGVALAREFGVSHASVYAIGLGRTWRAVPS